MILPVNPADVLFVSWKVAPDELFRVLACVLLVRKTLPVVLAANTGVVTLILAPGVPMLPEPDESTTPEPDGR